MKRYVLFLAVVWTLVISASFTWNYFQQQEEARQAASVTARAQFVKDVIYRRWNTEHGGVYVPITESTQPNPYLTQVEERDIETPSGQELTLINPAYMTRQVHELGYVIKGVIGHITSLNPIRPANAPDDWEKHALQTFEQGNEEFSSIETIAGEKHLRLMQPLVTEASCLKCHADQGYQEGEIRGGISVSVPMAPYAAIAREHITTIGVAHGLLWLLGLIGLLLSSGQIRKRVRERDQAERALKKYSERLEDMVAERTQALQNAQKQLIRKERLAAIGEFTGGIVHDLRHPLSVFSNVLYLLNSTITDPDEETVEYLTMLTEEVHHADQIITDLLEFARTGEAKPTTASIEKLVDEIIKKHPSPEGVTTKIQIPDDLPPAYIDLGHIRQALTNLIENAYDSMAEGGQLSVNSEQYTENSLQITIQDTGTGIPPENLEKIFEPLFTTKQKGIGLGLAITKTLVEANNGRIEVKSEVNEGTTFRIFLPVAKETDKQ
ncbi:MAG: DUF3365 domain-containing protein [Chloroflexota bacterium]|nr:DUF3365 domain-containing protein [Chloroflexota bacterium]